MIKKILFGFSGFAVAAAFPLGTFAQEIEPIVRPIPYPTPLPIIRVINVTPGNPLDLNSCGKLEVKGRGWGRIENFNGGVEVSVKGKLAVKEEDLGSVNIQGFNSKHRRGAYIVFHGRGTASGNSQDLDLIVLGKSKIESKGCGETHLKGHFEGSFQRFWFIYPLPEPQPLPLPVELQELEAEALSY